MKEVMGNLWDYHDQGLVVVITTGGLVDRQGRALMPRGCARQARERFPGVAKRLGQWIKAQGNHVYELEPRLVSFPVENSPYECPDLRLIERSGQELQQLANDRGWTQIVVPRPGCGGGGLDWRDVRPRLAKWLDDRFLLICPPSPPAKKRDSPAKTGVPHEIRKTW